MKTDIMITKETIENLLNGRTIEKLELEGYQGLDTCLETSLREYGYAWKEFKNDTDEKPQIIYLHGITVSDAGEYVGFDNGWIFIEDLTLENFDWCDPSDELKELDGTPAFLDAIASVCRESAFGSCYHDPFQILTECEVDTLREALEMLNTIG